VTFKRFKQWEARNRRTIQIAALAFVLGMCVAGIPLAWDLSQCLSRGNEVVKDWGAAAGRVG
jgi:hypothetical protein